MSERPRANSVFEMGDVLGAPEFGGFALSPDGSQLAIARIEYVRGPSVRRSRVAVLDLAAGDGDGAAAASPAPETMVFTGDCDGWSPSIADDNRHLLFLSDYAGEPRPWIATGPAEVPAPAPGVPRMAMAAKWRPTGAGRGPGEKATTSDGKSGVSLGPPTGFGFLSFSTRAEQGQPDPIDWGVIPKSGFRHLWCVDALDGAPRQVTSGPEDVYDFAFAPDGKSVAVLVAPSFEMERHLENELRILRVSDGKLLARHATEEGLNAFLSFSPAGDFVAWIAHGPGGRVGKADLWTLRLGDGEKTRLSAKVPGYVNRYDWAPDGRALWFPAAEGTGTALWTARRDGERYSAPRRVQPPKSFVAGLALARRGTRMVLRLEGPRTPPCLAVTDLGGPEGETLGPLRVVTARSARKESRIPGDGHAIAVRSPDGFASEAVVTAPRVPPDGRRPVCLWLHGGPTEFCALSYQPWWQLFVARGFHVLAPNFRGSGSASEERVRSNVGALGDGDADDVLASLAALEAHPELGHHVDTRRIVIFGWSYGAYLAFHVARRLGEKRAGSVRRIVAGGGVYDWLSHYGETELRFPWRDYLAGSPLLDAARADARSPVRMARALAAALGRAEVLLVHGINDGRANPIQSRVMYRALTEAGANAKLLLYRNEAHILVEPEHVRDLLDRATKAL